MTDERNQNQITRKDAKNCFVESNPIPTKAALNAMGLMENELRLPLVPASQPAYDLMVQTVKELGIL